MKFRIKCADERTPEGWWESYNENTNDAQKWAENIIVMFNANLRHGELPRTLLEVEVLNDTVHTQHEWRKISLVTERGRDGSMYDRYQCSRCGITGKRFGLNRTVKRDSQYKAKVYDDCDKALAHLEKR